MAPSAGPVKGSSSLSVQQNHSPGGHVTVGPAGGVDPMPSGESDLEKPLREGCGLAGEDDYASSARAIETVHGSGGRPASPGASVAVSLHSTLAASDVHCDHQGRPAPTLVVTVRSTGSKRRQQVRVARAG